MNYCKIGLLLLAFIHCPVGAEQSKGVEQPTLESPEDQAYQTKMIPVSNAISQKIAEIKKKQRELENEVYPAYKPAIQSEIDALNKELDTLKMQRDELESEKSVQDMTKKLENAKNAKKEVIPDATSQPAE